MKRMDPLNIALALLLVVVLGLAEWVWVSAPCGLWTYAKAGETPARCLMHR
ncbi:hypothetical protein [Streptomyces sp. NPDC059468]|uniref:hypothetical protein n=1 Tax=Streptomyces sp. NPDC059468 TaxID=3346845 RepID=UPI0036C26821